MKTTVAAVLAGLALAAGPAVAKAQEELRVALPDPHELVELQPGLQVIPEFDMEVFFTGGSYWLRTDGSWYSARRPAAATVFTLAEPRSVPTALAKLPPGSHLHYRPAPGQRRSTKVLATMDGPDRDAEVDAGPVRIEPAAVKPAPAKAPPAKAAPGKAPAKAAPAKAPRKTTTPATPAKK